MDTPAISETLPGFAHADWFAVVAPPKTPPEIALTLSLAIAEVLRLPEVAERFRDLSVIPVGSSPAETAAILKQDAERWRAVIVPEFVCGEDNLHSRSATRTIS
jgi:tripartite-type tricarboxylate transporter receptor subunit TctC